MRACRWPRARKAGPTVRWAQVTERRARKGGESVERPQDVQVAARADGVAELLVTATAFVSGRLEQGLAGGGIGGRQFGAMLLERLQPDV